MKPPAKRKRKCGNKCSWTDEGWKYCFDEATENGFCKACSEKLFGNRPKNMIEIVIYGMLDPRTGRIRYVGQTKTKLSVKVSALVSRVKKSKTDPLRPWVMELVGLGLRPSPIVIERLVVDDLVMRPAYQAEYGHIRRLLVQGEPLLNTILKCAYDEE